jgi:preprotein translocase SecE subunit
MSSLINYLKDARAELVHISWPTRETVVNHTMLVIGISVVVGIGLGLLDNGFGKALALFIGAR